MFPWPVTDSLKSEEAARSQSERQALGRPVRHTKLAQNTLAIAAFISCALIWIPMGVSLLRSDDGYMIQAILTIAAATVSAYLIAGYQFKFEANYAMRNAIGKGALVALCTLVATNVFSWCVGLVVAGPWHGDRTISEAFISNTREILIASGWGILFFSWYAALIGALAGYVLSFLYKRNPNAF